MDSIYKSNIQPLHGCNIQFIVDRGLHPRLFRLCHFMARFILKSNASVVIKIYESEDRLDYSKDCGYITQEVHKEMISAYDDVRKMLISMITNPEKWCSS